MIAMITFTSRLNSIRTFKVVIKKLNLKQIYTKTKVFLKEIQKQLKINIILINFIQKIISQVQILLLNLKANIKKSIPQTNLTLHYQITIVGLLKTSKM